MDRRPNAHILSMRAADRDVSVIALTKKPSVEAAVDTMKAEAYDYLSKPFKLERVLEIIDKAARERPASSARNAS